MSTLKFNSKSPYLIYSNYPEQIQGIGTNDHYTTEATINANQEYTVFLYYFNVSSVKQRIGVAIKNTGSSPLTVTYLGGGILTGNGAFDNCATLAHYCVNNAAGTSCRAVSNLAANTAAFMAYNDSSSGQYTVAKIRFKTNCTAKVRVFHGGTNTAISNITPAKVFTMTQDVGSSLTGESSRTSASRIDLEKEATVGVDDNNNPITNFNLFEHPVDDNENEYQDLTNCESHNPYSSTIVCGNFEQIYTLTMIGKKNKTLRLTPNTYPAQLITYTSTTGSWTKQPKLTSGYFTIPIQSNTETVKIILTGGNSGNYSCTLV